MEMHSVLTSSNKGSGLLYQKVPVPLKSDLAWDSEMCSSAAGGGIPHPLSSFTSSLAPRMWQPFGFTVLKNVIRRFFSSPLLALSNFQNEKEEMFVLNVIFN